MILYVIGNACLSIVETLLAQKLYFIIKLENLETMEGNKGGTPTHA